MFIAALFTVANTWKQPTCPSIDEKRWYGVYTHNGIFLSSKKEWNISIHNMCETRDYHTKWNSDKDILYHLYVESEKIIQVKLFRKQK